MNDSANNEMAYNFSNTQAIPLMMYQSAPMMATTSMGFVVPTFIPQMPISLDSFCLCDTPFASSPIQGALEESKKASTGGRRLKKDKYFSLFKEKADELCKSLYEDIYQSGRLSVESTYVRMGSKPAQSQNIKNPNNRSKYIGVAKNASKWQTLVCTKKDKIFLGNYETEQEAAKVVDFYSILVKGARAKVNQDYKVGDVKHMVEDFIHNGYNFNSMNFL
ncbi:unnamed protein product [Moneuplotes crassus]|uniref:AP2/ERF domain-containing protein n=1 Tax=Euplotes crassus TaxID=5936 RepID=A0AAD1Y1I5_EUPCR|nr:unnamed protein product [Moneuplotes crassus]